MIACSFKEHFGVTCFGCGFQRAIHLLFKGEILQSIQLFPAAIPLIILGVFTLLHLKFKFQKGASIIVILFSIVVALMILNFVLNFI
ncbi:DUF2752 domain-containing protein [Putridiphycobacter roseus]|uniref:DUF2752 domain-containing protein n=1 Tax=Putridiphycobacter roseus TaxID=2219161 RepID=A0A2W1N2D7_9FLAO|nr:DUF2752 domain-containing protein [Putridiphycobacter roseus]